MQSFKDGANALDLEKHKKDPDFDNKLVLI